MTAKDPAAAFHAHLDVCKRCREQPFNLCPIGNAELQKAGSNLIRILPSKPW